MVLEYTNPADVPSSPQAQQQQTAGIQGTQGKDQPGSINALYLAYLEICDSVQLTTAAASIYAKQGSQNIALQNGLVNREALYNFQTLSNTQFYAIKASKRNTYLELVSTNNEELSAIRQNLEGSINGLSQGFQTISNNTNSVADEQQQSVSQGASIMKMLTSISNQIMSM